MNRTDIPTLMGTVFAQSAAPGFIETVPVAPPGTPGKASFQTGFPPETFVQIAAGGTPPWGADMNGIMFEITKWLQWAQAGGFPIKYNSAFSASIGGYPKYALLLSSSPDPFGKMWLSTANANTTDPDSVGAANWVLFPDALIQRQKNNYAADTGGTNTVTVNLGILPAAWADIVGMPIRIKALHANTVNNPTLTVQGSSGPLAPATIVNPGGAVLGIGQFVTADILEGVPKDDGTFQLNSPAKQYSPSGTFPFAGATMPWANETVPSGWIEVAGQSLLIASFPNLWPVLGTRYGGDGVNTFNMPDWRGEFLRGWDHGRGLDPNAATRTNAGGGITGDHVGTNEAGAIKGSDLGQISLQNLQFLTGPALSPGSAIWRVNAGADLALFPNQWAGAAGLDVTAGGIRVLQSYANAFDGAAGYGLFGLKGDAGGGGLETRPVNINVMWIMFTG